MSPYTRFHTRLARHAIHQFVLSLKSSLEVVVLAAGQALLMALALLAWPLWLNTQALLAGTRPASIGLLWLLGYSALLALPVFLLRKRLLPGPVLAWRRSLPVSRGEHFRAALATAGLFMLPLALAYAISSAAWLSQLPPRQWQLPLLASGSAMLLLSILLSWSFSVLILLLRGWQLEAPLARLRHRLLGAPKADANPLFQPRPWQPRLLQMWYRLLFLPFWRLENGIGLQQCWLFLTSIALFWLWLHATGEFVRFLLCIAASSASLILTDRGDKAVQEQLTLLRPHLRTLPIRTWPLALLAKILCALPALLALALLACWLQTAPVHATVARMYLAMQLLAHATLIGVGHFSSAGRARLLILFMAVLSAFGSELWR